VRATDPRARGAAPRADRAAGRGAARTPRRPAHRRRAAPPAGAAPGTRRRTPGPDPLCGRRAGLSRAKAPAHPAGGQTGIVTMARNGHTESAGREDRLNRVLADFAERAEIHGDDRRARRRRQVDSCPPHRVDYRLRTRGNGVTPCGLYVSTDFSTEQAKTIWTSFGLDRPARRLKTLQDAVGRPFHERTRSQAEDDSRSDANKGVGTLNLPWPR
jgi:hypothetical protein